jgi:hypothetical protein
MFFLVFVTWSPLYSQSKEIPIIVEDSGSVSAVGSESVQVVKNDEKDGSNGENEHRSVKKVAKRVRKGAALQKLIKTFLKYNKGVVFDERYYDENSEAYSKKESENLRKTLIKWKKMRIRAKGLKRKKDPKFDELYKEIKEFEKRIAKKYGPAGEVEEEVVVEKKEKEGGISEESKNSEIESDIVPETETGRILLKKLLARGSEESEEVATDIQEVGKRDEDLEREKRSAEKELKKIRREREGRKHRKSNIKWRPGRVCFNRLQPEQRATLSFNIKNRGKYPFEGAIVPIEEWISVNPPTIYLEPRSDIDIDVTVVAPDKKKMRVEGSVEIRGVGEPSRRVPIVVRTVRK